MDQIDPSSGTESQGHVQTVEESDLKGSYDVIISDNEQQSKLFHEEHMVHSHYWFLC